MPPDNSEEYCGSGWTEGGAGVVLLAQATVQSKGEVDGGG